MLFLGIISWNGVSCFNGGLIFRWGASFLGAGGRGCPWWASVLVGGGGVSEKIVRWGVPPMPPLWESKTIVLY